MAHGSLGARRRAAFVSAAPGQEAASPPAASIAGPDDAAGVRDAVRAAAAGGRALRIAGRGRWLGAGRPVSADGIVSLASLTGIVEYVPGDLTLTARAGTSLEDIDRVTSAEGQWLTLDPFGDPGGSLGATVATASAGPLAHAFGTPRDNVLGVEGVTGTGAIVRGGGRVVKNVAGFDLTRLLTGSWGTLAILTEVTVRLRARPEADVTLALPLPADRMRRAATLAVVRQAPLQPLALEVIDGATAERLGCGSPGAPAALLRLAGNEVTVRAQERTVQSLGGASEMPASSWAELRRADTATDVAVVRYSALRSRFADLWDEVMDLTHSLGAVIMHGTPARGVVRCIVPRASDHDVCTAFARPVAAARIFERLPASCWPTLSPDALRTPLASAVRSTFDPGGVLNPGILGPLSSQVRA